MKLPKCSGRACSKRYPHYRASALLSLLQNLIKVKFDTVSKFGFQLFAPGECLQIYSRPLNTGSSMHRLQA